MEVSWCGPMSSGVCCEWLIRSTEACREECNTWNTNYQLKCQRNPLMKGPMFTLYVYTLPFRFRSSEKNTVQVKGDDIVRQISTTVVSRILICAWPFVLVCLFIYFFYFFFFGGGCFIFVSVNKDDLKWQLLLECNGNPQYPECSKTYFW